MQDSTRNADQPSTAPRRGPTRAAASPGWPQHGIAILACLQLIATVGCGGPDAAREKEAAAQLKKLGALVVFDGAREHVASVNLTMAGAKENFAEARPLIADLPYVGSIDMTGTGLDDEGLAVVAKLSKVSSLQLGDNAISDAGLEHLRDLGQVEALYLRNSKVSSEGLKIIGGLESLKILDLSGAQLDNADLTPLAQLENLQWLLLEEIEFSDEAIAPLESTQLHRLSVTAGKVSDEALGRLSAAVAGLKIDKSDESEAGEAAP